MANGMTSADLDATAHGLDIEGEWLAYGYILYYVEHTGYRVSLNDIEPGDGESSIADWARHIRGEYGEDAAEAFEDFATEILCDPWPTIRTEIRERLIAFGVRHKKWPPEGRPDVEDW